MSREPSPSPSHTLFEWGDASLLGQQAVQSRVTAHADYRRRRGTDLHVPPLVNIAIECLTNEGETTEGIPAVILARYIWDWHMMPYLVLCRALLRLSAENGSGNRGLGPGLQAVFGDSRIDEWIIRNERWLRVREHGNWQHGMVSLDDADTAFPTSVLNSSNRTVLRIDCPGFKIMDQARSRQLRIQPSTESFKNTFEAVSHGLLNNLDWNNLFVAGGIVVATLISVDRFGNSQNLANQWKLSDIDIYIHGLSPHDANRKVEHIFSVFRSNIPIHMHTLVVRNSKTITFYAAYPLRRIQIILKLIANPRDVLLNFDLDICAMGWDGSNVWMLPRAARALETGYNTFTMSLINGHYLSERRATQPRRIFKYAARGYGIRILPSYTASLSRSGSQEMAPVDVDQLAKKARGWTRNRYQFISVDLGLNRFLRSDLSPEGESHSDPMSSFTSLMRHVEFWEMGRRKDDVIIEQNDWASTSYEDTYENVPKSQYPWDEHFNPAELKSHIVQSNINDIDEWLAVDFEARLPPHGVVGGDMLIGAQRVTSASNAQDLLKDNIRMPILLPVDFAIYANELVNEAQTDAGFPKTNILDPVIATFDFSLNDDAHQREGLFWWTIGPHLMWQQLDRRIDEAVEVLYAFRRANRELEAAVQLERLKVELTRHRVSITAEDELAAFARWIGNDVEI
ncbi:hypothetical protein C8R46DRAFT_1042117 [Mycena filopes]|nr:hypothetical protein C8R46DRAFT_1042117 [Mycena filopes]